jgi:DNA-binding transcriptional LysR family regulator
MTRAFGTVQLGSIEIFIKTAELLSFSAAATELGLSPPAVSRSIARLEERLGVRLFARSTRQVGLTDDGRLYLEQCRQALRQISDAEDALTGRRQTPSGTLRISVPTTYGHYRIIPILPMFALRYPEIRIDINVSNRNINFVEEGYDLAIRLGQPADSRLVARKLEDATLGIYAAPSYLRAHKQPRTLADLKQHRLIKFELPSSGRMLPWIFSEAGADVEFAFTAQVGFSDDVLACVNYARSGGGLVQTYDFIANTDERSGRLVEVLKRYRGRSRPFSIVYPQNRHLSQRVRVFVDFVLQSVNASS